MTFPEGESISRKKKIWPTGGKQKKLHIKRGRERGGVDTHGLPVEVGELGGKGDVTTTRAQRYIWRVIQGERVKPKSAYPSTIHRPEQGGRESSLGTKKGWLTEEYIGKGGELQ